MNLSHAVVLITGANRGLGRAFAEAALAAGAAKVYAAARDPASIDLPGVVPLRLDVTDPAQVAAAAAECRDVTLLINNAGILRGGSLLAPKPWRLRAPNWRPTSSALGCWPARSLRCWQPTAAVRC